MTNASTAPAFVRAAETTPGTAAARPWAIRMNGIGKRYRLGEVRHLNDNFREDMMRMFGRLLKRGDDEDERGTFWAIRDISVEIERGDTVGIIGRNGAGKSTLLKVLSRITAPTRGEMIYRGRLASLLEVGTGFHRELTGRENIYLNGAILGMRRKEIDAQFDAIVDFAGVEKFLDTPVKFYSSGMYVRLAFAVAAHLRTDILVVDEVLAVGDAQFQKKCLGKMQDVAGDGRTVLFVSHNMGAVQRLCRKGLMLQEGKLVNFAPTDQIVQAYLSGLTALSDLEVADRTDRDGDGSARCTAIWLETEIGERVKHLYSGSNCRIRVEVARAKPILYSVNLGIYDETGIALAHLSTRFSSLDARERGDVAFFSCIIPKLPLLPGEYYLNVTITLEDGKRADRVQSALQFTVESGAFFTAGTLPTKASGVMLMDHVWHAEEKE